MQRTLVVVSLFAIVVTACGGDDDAAQRLTVTIEHPDRETLEYEVTCDDNDANVEPGDVGVDATAACATLQDANAVNRLVEGPPEDQMCAAIFGGPDVATVTGTIDGESVDTTITRMDGCGVADWDELLGGLLPPPVS